MTSLYTDQPSCVVVSNHNDGKTGDPVTDTVMTATIYDSDGVEVTGETWPLSMPYDAIALNYHAETDSPLGLTAGELYHVEYIGDSSGGSRRIELNIEVRASERGAS